MGAGGGGVGGYDQVSNLLRQDYVKPYYLMCRGKTDGSGICSLITHSFIHFMILFFSRQGCLLNLQMNWCLEY